MGSRKTGKSSTARKMTFDGSLHLNHISLLKERPYIKEVAVSMINSKDSFSEMAGSGSWNLKLWLAIKEQGLVSGCR